MQRQLQDPVGDSKQPAARGGMVAECDARGEVELFSGRLHHP